MQAEPACGVCIKYNSTVDSQCLKLALHHKCVQVFLVLRQGYVPEKRRTNRTQNSHLKQCISWGLGDWQPRPI
jgi:hypothetical protein